MKTLVRVVLIGTLALSCDSSTGGGGGAAGSSPSGGGGVGGAGSACTSAFNCTPGLVCSSMLTCASVACTTHTQCGNTAYCMGGMCTQQVANGVCDNDANCRAGETCTNGHCGCGGQLVTASYVAPNILIAIDRSGSMNDSLGSGMGTKWQVAKSAVTTLLTNYGNRIRFGLELWPGTNQSCSQGTSCGAGTVNVSIADNNATPIESFFGSAGTCMFSTPIGATLAKIKTDNVLIDTSRTNYVLFLTDGQDNCGGGGPTAAGALLSANPSVKTFVVGFGSGVDATELNNLATSGGTARTGTQKYYQADNAAALDAAFAAIAGNVVSCSYTLSTTPANAGLLFVYFGTTQISRDTGHTNGWDYNTGSMQLTFYGAACDTLKSGSAGNLVISYGCPPAQIF